MKIRIPLISNIIHYFRSFWDFLGARLLLLIAITFTAGLAESLGFVLFLPVLTKSNMAAATDNKVARFCEQLFQFINIPYTIYGILALITLLFLVKGIIKFCESAYRALLIARLGNAIRENLVTRFGAMSYPFYAAKTTGFFTNLVTVETNRTVAAFQHFVLLLIHAVTTCVLLIASLWIHWPFTLATALFGAAIVLCFKSITARSRTYSVATSQEYSKLSGMLIQTLQSFKFLKATGRFESLHRRCSAIITPLTTLQFKLLLCNSVIAAAAEPIVVAFIAGLMLFQIGILHASLAPILVAIMFFYKIIRYIMTLQREWQIFCSFSGSIDAVLRAADEIEVEAVQAHDRAPLDFANNITLNNICFSYDETLILSDINATIQKNATVAFVGESGVGKTTIADILTGILVPRSGAVQIDGAALQTLNRAAWRRRIGYVTQETFLYDDTVLNNISLWDSRTPEQVLADAAAAACKAHCDQFISGLEGGYQAMIGDRGIKLSGGQRQRLAIARELYHKPDVLILDEATSALDTESEQAIQQSLAGLRGTMTVILIAHRLSTLRNADHIYVLAGGRIVESGTFARLIEDRQSLFSKMWELQHSTT